MPPPCFENLRPPTFKGLTGSVFLPTAALINLRFYGGDSNPDFNVDASETGGLIASMQMIGAAHLREAVRTMPSFTPGWFSRPLEIS
jgi:hypothetical protein